MQSNDEKNNPTERAVVAANGEQQFADIFKLNIDCFEVMFDYLSLEDLDAMGQTCKRMQRITGHCFQQNYGAAQVKFNDDGFYLNHVKIDCFNNFLQNVKIANDFTDYINSTGDDGANIASKLMDFVTKLKHSTSIKVIDIFDVEIDEENDAIVARFYEMNEIVRKAENVTIRISYENVIDALLAQCSNIKYLYLKNFSIRNECKWMHQIYPMLEHIELRCKNDILEGTALKTFLEQKIEYCVKV
ncbi:uncharacterized protein LOC116351003 [Contarinia nasturtii]|uniref:uncharacterized protein LOC116351003 n=1 Tax=Contarinia nasturtii TaxID=265458 RepID=UPI0012D3E77B|nr:uncharacterized protein LOC116351003 [Contarinia nasturtii]XP_031638885.1 uncharacterized protein LOC116351003 [Contarinia nasturtii]XP_031638886.1 uncharacterized protein LOC116351003 [Contarinia nasturtii]XP_031638887.1 uncharacterized protein LOC116351003 [Contarinia nasturtii]